jgi:hypothetical protein
MPEEIRSGRVTSDVSCWALQALTRAATIAPPATLTKTSVASSLLRTKRWSSSSSQPVAVTCIVFDAADRTTLVTPPDQIWLLLRVIRTPVARVAIW